jgi:hypothetical protein
MTYRIKGLDRGSFERFFAMDDEDLARHGARRVIADNPRYPCRVSLEDAAVGESMILLNHVSNDVDGPYRATHAILVRETTGEAATLVDRTPPVFETRTLSLRAFDAAGEIVASRLSPPDGHDAAIRALLADPRVDHIDAHNAGHGCFSARIERYMESA